MNFQNDEPAAFVDNSDPFGMMMQSQPMAAPQQSFMPAGANDGADYSPEEIAIMAEVEQA